MRVDDFLEKVNDEINFLSDHNLDVNDMIIAPMFDNNKFIVDNYMKPLKYEIKSLCLNNVKTLAFEKGHRKSNLYLSAFYASYYLENYNDCYLKDDKRKPFTTLMKIREDIIAKSFGCGCNDDLSRGIIDIISNYGDALIRVALLNEPINIREVTISYRAIIEGLNDIREIFDSKLKELTELNMGRFSPCSMDMMDKCNSIIDFIDDIKEDVTDDLGQIVDFEFI